MKMQKQILLELCIEDKLEALAFKHNKNPNDLEINYLKRLSDLKESNLKEYKDNESKFMVKAYYGTVKYYEERQKYK